VVPTGFQGRSPRSSSGADIMKLPSGLVSQAQRILARVRVTIRLEVTDRHVGACAWCAAIGAIAASDAGRDADLALAVLALAAMATTQR